MTIEEIKNIYNTRNFKDFCLEIGLTPDKVRKIRSEFSRPGLSPYTKTIEILNELNITSDSILLEKFLRDLIKYENLENWYNENTIKFIKYTTDKNTPLDERIDFFNSIESIFLSTIFDNVYQSLFTKEEQLSYDVISKSISVDANRFSKLLKYTSNETRANLINNYYQKAYTLCRSQLTKEELDLVISKIRETDEVYLAKDIDRYNSGLEALMVYWKSPLLTKLKNTYGKSYVEKTKKSLDDDDEFVYTLFKSSILEQIYTKSMFTKEDTKIVNAILEYFEKNKKDVSSFNQRVEKIKEDTFMKEKNLYNFILHNKDNKEELDKYLTSLKINKDNFTKYVTSRKFLDKKLKNSILLILAKHYNTTYLSVYDIIDMIEESKTRKLELNELLNEKGISPKSFNTIYNKLKEDQYNVFTLIESTNNLSDAKKLIKLYYSVMNNNINNYDNFIKVYNYTPNQLLELFSNTPLEENILNKLSMWYDIKEDIKIR